MPDPPSRQLPDRDDTPFLRQFGRSHEATEFHSPTPEGYQRGRHRYVAVLGTVMSGLGKGIFSSSVAKLLKDKGVVVAPIKMEGYLNVDSGTLNPFRHGEVFVLNDGTECDMDLGTYERMLDQDLARDNFVTSGQIYAEILQRERKGGFLGRDVQMIPHVTGQVKLHLRRLAMTGGADGGPADVVFIEVGGTVGDYENSFYIEALRELAFEEGQGSTCFVALTYVLEPAILGEQKSKAAQLGIKRLMEAGIQPHIVACRARHPVTKTVMQKIAMYSNVPLKRVFSMHDRESIYTIPEAMWAEGLDREILSILDLYERINPVHEEKSRRRWAEYADRIRTPRRYKITLGITGKYTAVRDAYASIDRAIEHASTHLSADADVRWLDTSDISTGNVDRRLGDEGIDAIIVPGGFGERGVEGKIACVEYVRRKRIPYLGICLGFQMAVIEYARHVLGLDGANSTEFDDGSAHPVIAELPEQKEIEGLGGTMRLGAHDVLLEPDTLAWALFEPGDAATIRQRFRHRWEVEPAYIDRLVAAGLRFSGRHPQYPIMQVLELDQAFHPYFIAAQFHPELVSRPLHPHPMFMGLVAAAIARAHPQTPPADLLPVVRNWLRTARPENNNERPAPPNEAAPARRVSPA
jgi:CTP synthase